MDLMRLHGTEFLIFLSKLLKLTLKKVTELFNIRKFRNKIYQ